MEMKNLTAELKEKAKAAIEQFEKKHHIIGIVNKKLKFQKIF